MFLSDLLSEEKDESKEKIILDELKMYIDEKFIPIIEKIQYGNKYTIVEELKKMISELEYYVIHMKLIGNRHVAFYNPSVYVSKYIYKRYIKSIYSKQNVGFKKIMNCIFDQNKKLMNTFEVPTFIHGYDKKEGVYVESISQNKCQFNTEKYEQLLELSKKKNIDLKNLIYDISIYSENVPVIRDDSGKLLETPVLCSFITSPAVNRTFAKFLFSDKSITKKMTSRITKIISLALSENTDILVLGAFGCGVFGNKRKTVFRIFEDVVNSFVPDNIKVIFAVPD